MGMILKGDNINLPAFLAVNVYAYICSLHLNILKLTVHFANDEGQHML